MIRSRPEPEPAAPYRVLALVVLMLALVTTAEHWASMQVTADDPAWRTIAHALKSELPRWGTWLLAVPLARGLIRKSRWTSWAALPSAAAHMLLAYFVILAHEALATGS